MTAIAGIAIGLGQMSAQRFFNVGRVNQGLQKSSSAGANNVKGERRDRLNISPFGKGVASMLEGLQKQKEAIKEQQNDLIKSTLENGGSIRDIEGQLKNYEEQLKSIDTQITQTVAEQVKAQTEKKDGKAEKTEDKPKTKEEQQGDRLQKAADIVIRLDCAKVMSETQAKTERAAKALAQEIKQDAAVASPQMSGSSLVTTKKEEALRNMLDKANTQLSDLMSELGELSKSATEVDKTVITKAEDEAELNSDTDSKAEPDLDKKAENNVNKKTDTSDSNKTLYLQI